MDLTRFVNLFIGTEGSVPGTAYNGGNVFPGASLPFGAVKSIRFNSTTDATAGYTPDGNVTAITMMHESGTGGSPKYGVVPQMPLTTLDNVNIMDNLTYMQPRTCKDTASIGYYATSLANGVKAEMTATMHAGMMIYNYPQSSDKYILIDISHFLPSQDGADNAQFYSNGMLSLNSDGSAYNGWGTWRGGWNAGPDYTLYFSAQFDTTPESAKLWRGPYTDPYWPNSTDARATYVDDTTIQGGRTGYQLSNRIGAVFKFPPNATTVRSKISVSWISIDKAESMLEEEMPAWDFNGAVDAAKEAWNDKVLNLISLGDASNDTRTEMLYTALYHSHLLPSNRSGENPYWDPKGEPTFDDFYTAWDTFRCLNSMYLLMEPDVEEQIVRSLIDIWRHERFMPDGRSSNYNGRVQGGSNADNILADGYVKGLRGAINWTDGYKALLTDAEVEPYNNFDPEDLSQATQEGRGGLSDWHQLGYISVKFGRSISKTVEYSLNDFAVSQVAQGEGTSEEVQKYLNRSAGWQRIWRPIKSLNYTGFLAPLFPNGTIQEPYDPLSCGACEWNSIAYEALPWEYSWTVPFDMQTLIDFMGGPEATESRLDSMFVPGLKTGSVGSGGTNGIGTTLFNPGNEPSFQTPFLYHYLPQNRQYKSVQRSRETVNTYYNTGPSGLPGNSDAGAVDSWLIWNFIGLWPVATQDIYLILSPWFSDLTIKVGGGKSLHITAENLSDDSYYIQSVTLNGKPWTQNWMKHSDLVNGTNGDSGGEIHFVLGSQQTEWDTGDVPPSPGHVNLNLPTSYGR